MADKNTDEFDLLGNSINSDEGFSELLKDGVFVDYFNTFLSLPVFAKRLFYKMKENVFELDPPIRRTTYHLIKENLSEWVGSNRLPLFLRTGICNEYRLCKLLISNNCDASFDKESLALRKRYFGGVVRMQHLKAFLRGTAGERVFMFWLDAEVFRRHTREDCRRFYYRELQTKYLRRGSYYELSEPMKQEFEKQLHTETQVNVTNDHKNCNEGKQFIVLKSTALVGCQNLALAALRQYWIPKYLAHKEQHRKKVNRKWRKTVNFIPDKAKKIAKLRKYEQVPLTRPKSSTTSLGDIVNDAIKSDGVQGERSSESSPVSKRVSTNQTEAGSLASLPSESDSQLDELYSSSDEDDVTLSVGSSRSSVRSDRSGRRSSSLRSRSSSSKRKIRFSPNEDNNSLKKDAGDEVKDSVCSNYFPMKAGVSNIEGMEQVITWDALRRPVPENTIELPALASPYAQQSKKEKKMTFFEAMHKQRALENISEDPQETGNREFTCIDSEEGVIAIDSSKNIRKAILMSSVSRTAPLREIDILRKEVIARVKSAYPSEFLTENSIQWQAKDRLFDLASAAFTSDQLAGQPFCNYLQSTQNDYAWRRLRFWAASSQLLATISDLDTVAQHRQIQALVNVYLEPSSPLLLPINKDLRAKLKELLLRDLGLSLLMDVCDSVVLEMIDTWKDYLKTDEENFVTAVVIGKSKNQTLQEFVLTGEESSPRGARMTLEEIRLAEMETERELNVMKAKRMWRALELAMSINKPQRCIPLSSDEESEDEIDSSLTVTRLRILNLQAQRALNEYRKYAPSPPVVVHFYHRQSIVPKTMEINEVVKPEKIIPVTKEVVEIKRIGIKKTQPKPRTFQDVLTDHEIFDNFKKFLAKEGADTPLLFWQTVESLRTNTKGGKARQIKTNGIVRRYFGAATEYGKSLQCDADIIKELVKAEKVTPPMLMSAQACIAKSIEEKWYARFLKTFPDEEDLGGITLLPQFGDILANGEATRTFKNKTRGLWRMFARNVISFRRGIMSQKTKMAFIDYLKYENAQTVQQNATDGDSSRTVIRSKVIYTDKLIRDLLFWAEVEKYKDFADAVVLCARLGNYTKNDELIVVKKAYAIIDCFIDSQIPPRVQINVPTELAENVMSLVRNGIIERGLFHEAALNVFSCLMHYWQRFCLFRCMPTSEIPRCPPSVKSDRSLQIAMKQRAIKANKARKVPLPPDEECPKLMFSLQNGIRLAIGEPKDKNCQSATKA